MIFFNRFRKAKLLTQLVVGLALVFLVAGFCLPLAGLIGYRVVALVLLVVVSICAMVFDIVPVISVAIASALVLNFLFIPPLFTFHISGAEDLLMFLLYFLIALVHAVLSANIKRAERNARDQEQQSRTIQLYDTLLNSLSHELRTPISTILSAVDVVKENKSKLTPADEVELLKQIEMAALRLNEQVENLLNMSRLESGTIHLHLDWCDIVELLNNVVRKVDTSQHIVTCTIEPNLPLFHIDSGLLEQALYNVIHNAISYTPPQSVIQIRANQSREGLLIEVSDNGNQLAQDQVAKLFDKFYRAPQSKPGGSGLGLAIVKGFIEAHHGTIEAKLNDKGGLLLHVFIPSQQMSIHHE